MTEFDPPLDVGIAPFVLVLMDAGIETFESCQGGAGHSYPVPTVRFHGKRGEGFRPSPRFRNVEPPSGQFVESGLLMTANQRGLTGK